RVTYVLKRTTRGLQGDPHLTEALTRAFMFADASAAAEVDQVLDCRHEAGPAHQHDLLQQAAALDQHLGIGTVRGCADGVSTSNLNTPDAFAAARAALA
ncbi:MAG: hypothetical protein ACTS5I_12595, partial [Rhodanobacter sp.]